MLRRCRYDREIIFHILDHQIGERDDGGSLTHGADEYSERADGEAWVADAELETSIQEEAHFPADRPDSNADLSRRAGGNVSAGERLLEDEACAVRNPFRADGAVACQRKAVKARRCGAYQNAIIIVAAAQAGLGGDLGVEIAQGQLAPQAHHEHLALHGDRQAVVLDVGAGLVRGGDVPQKGIGEVVRDDFRAETGAHLRRGGFGG